MKDDKMLFYDENKPAKHEKELSLYLRNRVERKRSDQGKRYGKSWFVNTLIKHSKMYCKYSKLAGFNYFVEPETSWYSRVLLILVYSVIVPAMIYTIYHQLDDFFENPCFTSVDTEYFPTQDLNFPGVAICSINRISRQAALEMANEIFERNITRSSIEEILEMFTELSVLYDSETSVLNRTNQIHKLLTQYYNGDYNVTDIMKRLTPQCSAILSKCRFHDEDRNCSEVFEFRKTQDGFCCTFNYAIKQDDRAFNDAVDHRLEPAKVDDFGPDQGLSVLLEPFLDDYFYSIFPITGWKVTIFNPHDYPDTTSGGVSEIFVSAETQQSVELRAIISYGTKNIMPISLEHRHCVFPEEMDSYTYSDCIVECRTRNMWDTCGCIPFYLPNDSKRVCNLEDVPCLSQHKHKWFAAMPHAYHHGVDTIDDNEVLICSHCFPTCNDVTYSLQSTFYACMTRDRHQTKLLNGVDYANQSTVQVYFTRVGTVKLKQNVASQWYDLLSQASGIGGIFIGFSLIAIVELSYFVGLFVLEVLKGPDSSDGIEDETERKQLPLQTIYWGELYPRTRLETMANRPERIAFK
ncbi:sodium channel protein Nach-like [Hylaeus anthracinus]|uniref:sodium channel protein Nach-like n=1 Tax=Hylaeus anthracinus TaxID=313031 RepID=UPI0023BA0943|nr:sodium channel protein Nach-like [Hylaeus anthracinus]